MNHQRHDVFRATQDSAAATLQTLTRAAPATDHRLMITAVIVHSSGAAPAAAGVTVELQENTTAIVKGALTSAQPSLVWLFDPPIPIAKATQARVVVAAGPASMISHANLIGFIKRG